MKAVSKKLLSLLVAVMLLVSVVPFSAMAAEGEEMTEELPITLEEGIEYLNKHFAKVVVK